MSVRGDRILALGSRREIEATASDTTKVVDLKGLTVIPGFIESHAHFFGLGESKLALDLTKARNWDEIVEMVAQAAAQRPEGEWIIGRGWHQDKWDSAPQPSFEGLPLNDVLSRRTPKHPVLLTHASGHACIANARAMELAGVTSSTPDPEGGEILRDSKRTPIGVFRENAQGLIDSALERSLAARSAEQVEADRREIVRLASEECLSKGITTFHDAGASIETVEFLGRLADSGDLPVRLYVMLGEPNRNLDGRLASLKMIGRGNQHLTVRAIKRYMDGALGAHGAWLLDPYEDLPSSRGLNTEEIPYLEETARMALSDGFQLCIHAIGDRANREVLDLYERFFLQQPGGIERRWRIEHAQHLSPQDIPRFTKLGVIAAMQGVHATSDGPWVPRRLGEQRSREGAYVWRSLLDSGAVICNGTDAPVEDVDPIRSYFASVTRQTADGTRFYPEQVMTRLEALHSYTTAGAFAGFEENLKGTLTPGKLADFVVLSQDLLTVPDERIPETQVLLTVVGGATLFRNPAF